MGKHMVKKFNLENFKNSVKSVLEIKKENPYIRSKWIVSGKLAECALRNILAAANEVNALLREMQADGALKNEKIKTEVSRGIGYFPRRPWISVLVGEEKTSNGVFPVIVFDEKGLGIYVGCADSMAHPQDGFVTECYTREELANPNAIPSGDKIKYSEHLAKGAEWLQLDELTGVAVKGALRKALDVREHVRRKFRLTNECWIEEVKVKSCGQWLKDLNAIISETGEQERRHWVFRGQGKSEWPLTSTLERRWKYYHDEDAISNNGPDEKAALRHFKCISSQKLGYRKISDIDLEALMQHYGGVTRLLDFTWSPLVALYMAVDYWRKIGPTEFKEARSKDGVSFAVWAIDLDCLGDWSTSTDNNEKLCDVLDGKGDPDGLNVVCPTVMNTRLAAQEGLFLMPARLNPSIDVLLKKKVLAAEAESRRKYALKYVFDATLLDEAEVFLRNLCITPKMIYPDLKGMAEDCISLTCRQ